MSLKEQKYALVTGASSGIGYEISIALTKKGYQVFGTAPSFDADNLKPLEKYGVITFPLDVTKLEEIKEAKRIVQEKTGGKLDILYNNGGIAIGGPAIEVPEELVNKLFQVNLIGQINMTSNFSELVIAAKGRIVFTSSVAGIVPLSWISIYNASKAGLDMYAKTLQSEVEPFGVRVHSVITGGVNTAICDKTGGERYPKNSLYNVEGIEESIAATSNMSRNKSTTEEPKVYAEGVVKKITNDRFKGFNIYKGGRAYRLHLAALFCPLWLLQWAIAFHFKQLKPFKSIRKRVAALKTA